MTCVPDVLFYLVFGMALFSFFGIGWIVADLMYHRG